MTAEYNPTEAQRLIAEAREDDEIMRSESFLPRATALAPDEDCIAIARTRNNLPALADQLEASGMEVERLRTQTFANWTLRQQLDGLQINLTDARADLTKAKDEHTGDGLAWFEKEHALTMETDSLRRKLENARRDVATLDVLLAANAQVYDATKRDHRAGRDLLVAMTRELEAAKRLIADLKADRTELRRPPPPPASNA